MKKTGDRDWLRDSLDKALEELAGCRHCPAGLNTDRGLDLMGQQAVHRLVDDLVFIFFPGCHGQEALKDETLDHYLAEKLETVALRLKEHVRRALQYRCKVTHEENCRKCDDCEERARAIVMGLLTELPALQNILQEDVIAAYEGDPAAMSTMEVVMSYPGLYAIIVHRVANVLYGKEVPLIPRIMSEYAHSRTGIDIHPGARIGPGFFIDHGTGVVIGETCVIGRNVKIYQGVTLGALSFEKDSEGQLVKGIKRHPNVEDNVVIYAGATILGGKTTIGAGSEIGGNVWLTQSVPPGSTVYNQQPKPLIRSYEEKKARTKQREQRGDTPI